MLNNSLILKTVAPIVAASMLITIYYGGVKHMAQLGMGISVWLVKDIDLFQSKVFSDSFYPSSGLDRSLKISFFYEEWHALLFDVLKADPESYRDWAEKSRLDIDSDLFNIPKYPMLSRLNDNLIDVTYSQFEVEALRQEAASLIVTSPVEPARNLLQKILDICDEARRQNLSIYILSP